MIDSLINDGNVRSGSLWKPTNGAIWLYPTKVNERPLNTCPIIRKDEIFLVVAVRFDEELARAAQFYNLTNPWLVLFKEKLWLARMNKLVEDVTPLS